MDFQTLVIAAHKPTKVPVALESEVTLAFDPGHTTGWALFEGLRLIDCGEIETKSIEQATGEVGQLIRSGAPHSVIIEEYRVYKWRAKHHAGSDLLTARVIGCIETLCSINQIAYVIKQPAHIAKGFCKDSKLKEWGFYRPGEKHARDAVRHGCYYLIRGPIKQKQRQGVTVG